MYKIMLVKRWVLATPGWVSASAANLALFQKCVAIK